MNIDSGDPSEPNTPKAFLTCNNALIYVQRTEQAVRKIFQNLPNIRLQTKTPNDPYINWAILAHDCITTVVTHVAKDKNLFISSHRPQATSHVRKALLEALEALDDLSSRAGDPLPTDKFTTENTVQDAGALTREPSPPVRSYADVAGLPSPPATPPESTPPPPQPSSKPRPRPSPGPKPAPKPHGSAAAHPPAKPVKKPVRLVVHLSGKDRHRGRFTNNTYWYRLLAESFRRHRSGISLLGMNLNRRGNLLLSFPDNTPRHSLMDRLPIIRGTLGLEDDIVISFDTSWSTIHLANIPARPDMESPVFSEAELTKSLLLNPAIKGLAITSRPRWIRKPENITGARTSAVLSFEDADGSIARLLLKTPIFAFGAPVTVKLWLTKPANSVRRSTPPRPPSSMDVI